MAQLQQWREHLPPPLAWEDDQVPEGTLPQYEPKTVVLKDGGADYKMVHTDIVLAAGLRTRYKLAKYLIWRPYIFKALHSPGLLTDNDLAGCEQALQVSLSWSCRGRRLCLDVN